MNSCSQLSEMSMISQVMSFLYHGPCLHLYLSLIRRMRRMMMMLIPRWALIRSGVMSGWTIRDWWRQANQQQGYSNSCTSTKNPRSSSVFLIFVQTESLNLIWLTAIFLFMLVMTEGRMNVVWRAPKSHVFSTIYLFYFTFGGRWSHSNCQ